jgi:hypothetical protein
MSDRVGQVLNDPVLPYMMLIPSKDRADRLDRAKTAKATKYVYIFFGEEKRNE